MIDSLYRPFRYWSNVGTMWLYSDPHFGDWDLRNGIPNRPGDEELVDLINSKVGKKDTFICLGDVGNVEYIKKIRGHKVLVCGNHDAGASTYKRHACVLTFAKEEYSLNEAMAEAAKEFPERVLTWEEHFSYWDRSYSWVITADNMLFDEVYSGPLMIHEKIILSHEPLRTPWAFNIHGHVHSGGDTYGHLNVCADVINYTPVNFTRFMKSGRLSEIKDIHRLTIDKIRPRRERPAWTECLEVLKDKEND